MNHQVVTSENCPGIDSSVHGWIIAATTHRDADDVTRANWKVFVRDLLGEDPGRTPFINDHVQLHRFGHWACGWLEVLIVDPDHEPSMLTVRQHREALSDYPVLDDRILSEVQYDDMLESWDGYGASDFRQTMREDLEDIHWDLIEEMNDEELLQFFFDHGGDFECTGVEVHFDYPAIDLADLRAAL